MTPEAGLIASRFIHDMALTLIFGAALFQFYAGKARPAGLRAALIFLCLVGVASGAAWFAFTGANMAGDLARAADQETLSATLDTPFGAIWIWHLGLVVALLLIVSARRERNADALGFVELLVAAAALTSIAMTGHTQIREGLNRTIHVIGDSAHLLAAGAWLGGLFALLLTLLAARRDALDEATAAQTLIDFSPIGYVAVATLAFTGTINTVYLVRPLSHLFDSVYGGLLLAKLALVAFMLLLAAMNRFVFVPRLTREAERPGALFRFKRQVALEQLAGLVILAIVALLGMTEPPMVM